MTDPIQTPTRDWLVQQLDQLKAWRLALMETRETDGGLAIRIARHERWLAAELDRIGSAST